MCATALTWHIVPLHPPLRLDIDLQSSRCRRNTVEAGRCDRGLHNCPRIAAGLPLERIHGDLHDRDRRAPRGRTADPPRSCALPLFLSRHRRNDSICGRFTVERTLRASERDAYNNGEVDPRVRRDMHNRNVVCGDSRNSAVCFPPEGIEPATLGELHTPTVSRYIFSSRTKKCTTAAKHRDALSPRFLAVAYLPSRILLLAISLSLPLTHSLARPPASLEFIVLCASWPFAR